MDKKIVNYLSGLGIKKQNIIKAISNPFSKSMVKSKVIKALSTEELILEYLGFVGATNKKQTEEFIADLLVYIMDRVEILDKEELLALVESKLMHLSYTIDSSTLEAIYTKSAIETATELGVAFSFSQNDAKVVKSVNQSLLWLKDDGSIKTQESIKKVLNDALKGEINTSKIGATLRDAFDGVVDESVRYFTNVSDHTIRESQSLTRAYTFEKAGVKFAKIQALNGGTAPICKSLDGKLISVSHLVTQADTILEATTVEEKKEAKPWQNKEIEGEIPPYIGLPPYHFGGCHTIIVAHFED